MEEKLLNILRLHANQDVVFDKSVYNEVNDRDFDLGFNVGWTDGRRHFAQQLLELINTVEENNL